MIILAPDNCFKKYERFQDRQGKGWEKNNEFNNKIKNGVKMKNVVNPIKNLSNNNCFLKYMDYILKLIGPVEKSYPHPRASCTTKT